MVKVDASDVGERAILSQHMGEKNKMYPIAFFSQKLSGKTKL